MVFIDVEYVHQPRQGINLMGMDRKWLQGKPWRIPNNSVINLNLISATGSFICYIAHVDAILTNEAVWYVWCFISVVDS